MLVTTVGGLWVELEPGDIVALSCTKTVDEPVIFVGFDTSSVSNVIRYKRPFDEDEQWCAAEGTWIKLLEKGSGLIQNDDDDERSQTDD